MRKNTARLAALALASAMVLTACGGSSSQNTGSNDGGNTDAGNTLRSRIW
ncbi:MAG: hypothetical protein V8S27_08680 [Lachnospiraceae bacterium]